MTRNHGSHFATKARMRVFNRAWTTAAAQRPSNSFVDAHLLRDDPVLKNATRFALKLGEHTWGRDVKSNLVDNDDWHNSDFHRAKTPPAKTAPQFEILEESWWEQREWGVTLALDTLNNGDHALAQPLLDAVAALQPRVPNVRDGFKPAQPGTVYTCEAGSTSVDIAFDATGAVTRLGRSWVDEPGSALLQLVYRTYSAADVASFFAQYCKSNAGWVQHDYGKPNLPADVEGNNWTTSLVALWTKPTTTSGGGADSNCDFVAQLSFDDKTVTDFGAPAQVWLNVSVIPGVDRAFSVQTQIGMFNKTQTRLPEAMFVQFTAPQKQRDGLWSANKLGEWISSTEIIDGGTKHLHGVTDKGLKFDAPSAQRASPKSSTVAKELKSFTVTSMDAGVVNFGELTAYPSPVHTDANTTGHGSSFVLWDNLWGTNYVMWWPFQQPPPPQYAASSKYFPADWNSHMTFRYTINVTEV